MHWAHEQQHAVAVAYASCRSCTVVQRSAARASKTPQQSLKNNYARLTQPCEQKWNLQENKHIKRGWNISYYWTLQFIWVPFSSQRVWVFASRSCFPANIEAADLWLGHVEIHLLAWSCWSPEKSTSPQEMHFSKPEFRNLFRAWGLHKKHKNCLVASHRSLGHPWWSNNPSTSNDSWSPCQPMQCLHIHPSKSSRSGQTIWTSEPVQWPLWGGTITTLRIRHNCSLCARSFTLWPNTWHVETTFLHTGWCLPVLSWFINPAINRSVKPLIRWSSYLLDFWGPHPAGARWTTRKHSETNSKSWEKPGTKKLPTKPGLKDEGHRAKSLHLTKSGWLL